MTIHNWHSRKPRLSCLGPKKQDFWPKTNWLKAVFCESKYLVTVPQKLDMLLENKAFQELKLSKKIFFYKKCSSKQLFLIEKIIQKYSDDSWHRKFTLKIRFWHFLTNCQNYSTVVSFEYVDFWPNILLYSYPDTDLWTSAVFRVIEQCCFNSVSDWLF